MNNDKPANKKTNGCCIIASKVFAAGSYFVRAVSFVLLLVSLNAFAANDETFGVLQVGDHTYHDVTVRTKAKDYVFILHSSGMTSIKVTQLPIEVRQKLGYTEKAPALTPKRIVNRGEALIERAETQFFQVLRLTGSKLQQLITSRLTPSNLSTSATAFLSFLGTLNTLFLNVVIVLILAFYMMLDGHKLVRQVLAYFPPAVDEVMEDFHLIINRKFGGYLRGQFILALSYGLLTYIISVGFGLSYTVLLAVLAAVMMLIPFIGAIAAIVPPLVAFVLMHVAEPTVFPVVRFVLLFVFLVVAQHIVINLLAPRVMSTAMGMHPLLVLLGLLLGAKLAGIWGAIFGVPVLGVALDMVDVIYRHVMHRRYGFQPMPVTNVDGEDKTGRGPAPPLAALQRRHRGRPAGRRRAGFAVRPRARPGDTHVSGAGPVG